VTDEVIAVLRSEDMTDKQRKSDIEPLLMTKITEEYFSTLLNMAKELNDYTTDL